MTFPQTAVTKAIAGFKKTKKLSGIFIVLHQSLLMWWNLKSTTETVTPDKESGVIKAELMSWELAHQGAHQGRKLCQ